MSFRLENETVTSTSSTVQYRSSDRFIKLVGTLSSDEIPRAVVLLGVLTEQLEPLGQDSSEHVDLAKQKITDVPTTDVPKQTVKAIEWILSEVREILDEERKEIIGELVSTTGLDGSESVHRSTQMEQEKNSTSKPDGNEQGGEINRNSTKNDRLTPDNEVNSSEDQNIVLNNSEQEIQNKSTAKPNPELNENIECEFCSATIQSNSSLISHQARCDERPKSSRVECKHCGQEYISEQVLFEHLKSCGPTGRSGAHVCSNCGEKFEYADKLLEHHRSCGVSQPASRTQATSQNTTIERNVTGVVVQYNSEDGYGFITPYTTDGIELDESEDIFFHITEHPDEKPEQNQRLQYDLKQGSDGLEAVNIRHADRSRVEPWDSTLASKRPRWGRDT